MCIYIYFRGAFHKISFHSDNIQKKGGKNYKLALFRKDENKNNAQPKTVLHRTDTKSKAVLTTSFEADGELHSFEIETRFFHALSGSKNLSRADLLWYVRNLQSPKTVARSQ